MYSLFDRLGVNVASVVVGALFFLIAISWIEAFKGISDKVFFDDGQEGRRYTHQARKKLLSAIFVTVLAGFLIIVLYVWYENSVPHDMNDDQIDLFPGIVDIPDDDGGVALASSSIMR